MEISGLKVEAKRRGVLLMQGAEWGRGRRGFSRYLPSIQLEKKPSSKVFGGVGIFVQDDIIFHRGIRFRVFSPRRGGWGSGESLDGNYALLSRVVGIAISARCHGVYVESLTLGCLRYCIVSEVGV